MDAGQVASSATAVLLGILPRPPMGKVPVAVALELVPAMVTALCVWEVERECEGRWPWPERPALLAMSTTSPPERDRAYPRSLWG